MVGRGVSSEFGAFGIVRLLYLDVFERVLVSNGNIQSIMLVKGRVVDGAAARVRAKRMVRNSITSVMNIKISFIALNSLGTFQYIIPQCG